MLAWMFVGFSVGGVFKLIKTGERQQGRKREVTQEVRNYGRRKWWEVGRGREHIMAKIRQRQISRWFRRGRRASEEEGGRYHQGPNLLVSVQSILNTAPKEWSTDCVLHTMTRNGAHTAESAMVQLTCSRAVYTSGAKSWCTTLYVGSIGGWWVGAPPQAVRSGQKCPRGSAIQPAGPATLFNWTIGGTKGTKPKIGVGKTLLYVWGDSGKKAPYVEALHCIVKQQCDKVSPRHDPLLPNLIFVLCNFLERQAHKLQRQINCENHQKPNGKSLDGKKNLKPENLWESKKWKHLGWKPFFAWQSANPPSRWDFYFLLFKTFDSDIMTEQRRQIPRQHFSVFSLTTYFFRVLLAQ